MPPGWTHLTHDRCPSRIDIDDVLVTTVMRRYGLRTKTETVDLALRRLLGVVPTREEFLALEGSGWDGDLDPATRSQPSPPGDA